MIPNLDLNNLVIFYIVAKEKSLSAAADKLFLTQPAVTYRIKSLEKYTGVKLLEFKKRQATLTPHGEELFRYAEDIYRQLVNADMLIKSATESYLRAGIASMYTATVGPVVKQMFEEIPQVNLTVRSGDAATMVQDVLDLYLDLAIVPHFDYNVGKLSRITVSGPQKIVCFASTDQTIEGEPLSWKDMSNYPLVSGPESSVIRKVILAKLKSEGLELQKFAAEVNNTEWCKTLVENGKGLSFTIAEDIAGQVSEVRLKTVALDEDMFLTAEVIMRSDTFMNPHIKQFIRLVKKAFGYKGK